MNRLKISIHRLVKGLSVAVLRFPFTVVCLVAAAAMVCYLIANENQPPLIVEKLIFTLGVGAFIGMVAQFSIESFKKPANMPTIVYGIALLLTAGYFLIIRSAPEISNELLTRSFVAIFAMTCAVIWIPSFKKKNDFNVVALVHFKSFFVSLLYSGVLSAGISAILLAIDTLLFNVGSNSYAYMLTVIWIVFAPVYYLSLLPRFSEGGGGSLIKAHQEGYPRFLEILISYISIPLFSAYTVVLLAYFAKILLTSQWPSGQLGPMVLIYSALGTTLFVLASLPENSFTRLFLSIFPKVWIPIVLMQMVSVWIRLNAYGITEARYYVGIFAIFSLITAIFLSFRPVSGNRYIALLAAAFAILSIVPPIDAFSVSRNSQINRIESILQAEGMLSGNSLNAKKTATEDTKREVTSILQYLENNSTTRYISWLPEDFEMYSDMKKYFGFEPFYDYYYDNDNEYFYAGLNTDIPLDISGYDVSLVINSYMGIGQSKTFEFSVDGKEYNLTANKINDRDVKIMVKDQAGKHLIELNMLEFAMKTKELSTTAKEVLHPDEMMYSKSENGAGLLIIFQDISMQNIKRQDFTAEYTAYVLFSAP